VDNFLVGKNDGMFRLGWPAANNFSGLGELNVVVLVSLS
jgi:hypothetical protein